MDKKPHKKTLKELVEEIHRTVIKIENVHGDKIDALGEGLSLNNERLDRVEKRLDRIDERFERVETHLSHIDIQFKDMKTEMAGMEKDVNAVNQKFDRVDIIANDHEPRLHNVESSLAHHLEKHA